MKNFNFCRPTTYYITDSRPNKGMKEEGGLRCPWLKTEIEFKSDGRLLIQILKREVNPRLWYLKEKTEGEEAEKIGGEETEKTETEEVEKTEGGGGGGGEGVNQDVREDPELDKNV